MSNRQERNQRKANRRAERVLKREWSAGGCEVHLQIYNFGHVLTVGLSYQPLDGRPKIRAGYSIRVDRWWRRMDTKVEYMIRRSLNDIRSEWSGLAVKFRAIQP